MDAQGAYETEEEVKRMNLLLRLMKTCQTFQNDQVITVDAHFAQIENDRDLLLQELKRLTAVLIKARKDPHHFCDDDGTYIDVFMFYEELKSSEALIKKIEG